MQKIEVMGANTIKNYCENDVSRADRDRPGGHHSTPVMEQGWKSNVGRNGRKYSKKVFAKTARRQHKEITRVALKNWMEDREEVSMLDADYYYAKEFGADWYDYQVTEEEADQAMREADQEMWDYYYEVDPYVDLCSDPYDDPYEASTTRRCM